MGIWTLWSFMKGEAAREWHNTPHLPWVSSCTWYKETFKMIHVCLHVIPEEMIKLLKPHVTSISWDSSLQGARVHVHVVGESRHLSKLHESKAETFKPRPSTHAFRFGAPICYPSRSPVISQILAHSLHMIRVWHVGWRFQVQALKPAGLIIPKFRLLRAQPRFQTALPQVTFPKRLRCSDGTEHLGIL